MRTSGIRLQLSARIEPPEPLPIRGRGLARGEEAAEDALAATIGSRPGRDALVVEAEGAEAAGRGRVGGDVHVLGAVAEASRDRRA